MKRTERRVHRHLSPELERKLERTKHRRPHRPTQQHRPLKGGGYRRSRSEQEWRNQEDW